MVVQFDTTEQDFKLQEAEADLAEAEQQVLKPRRRAEAQQEENRYALLKAKADVRLAELEVPQESAWCRPLWRGRTTWRSKSARDQLAQLEQDLANRQATNQAGVAIQEAARSKAEVQAATARRNIESMTLRAAPRRVCGDPAEHQRRTWVCRGMSCRSSRWATASARAWRWRRFRI